MPEITLPEGTIAYRVVGPQDSTHPTVLFVHGILVDNRLWTVVADQLAERGYRCVLPTLPLGSHTIPLDAGVSPTPRTLARMVRDLIVELDLGEVTLVGCDTGGALCQFVIDEYPDLVGRLVLTNCDAFDRFPPTPFKQVFALMRGPRTVRALMTTMRSTILRHSPLGFGLLVSRAGTELTRSWTEPSRTDPLVGRDLVGLLRAIRPADLLEVSNRLPRFDKPVTLVWGQNDRSFTPRLGRRLADRFPDSTYVAVPGARTFVAIDEPDAVSSAIESISHRPSRRG
ncbi:alpha/beta fold hydrolase [Williamsia maris]|uniref:Pimeloyl-ACP methyl ester carboxylesterase n=1 Tax=Williamsia maris TaxID=72806 RepID=A0ABT1HAB2_9NOCA|nr:alpha/beta hydrolase [Williamsia maris]MCP2175193.1 Pimeloyl-ACP methyl ester carboxylesterase [Williamsia maris]